MIKFRKSIQSLSPYVPGKPIEDVKKEFGLSNVVKIASNENPYGCSEKVKEAVKNSLDAPQLYPDGNCTILRDELSKKLNIPKNQLIFGSGTDELITLLARAVVEDGDECIAGEISFAQYANSVTAVGGKMVYSKMKNHAIDLDDMVSKITDKTKIIFIPNPNNPTGTAFDEQEQINFLEKVPKNIIVVFDEAYGEFASDFDYPNTLEHLKKYENIVWFKTFSKAYGLASYRVGYAVCSEFIISNLERIRNPFNVSYLAQVAGTTALKDDEFVSFTIENNKKVRDFLFSEFEKLNLYYIPSQTNFVMVDLKKDSRIIFKKLLENGYIIRPGYAFKMDSYIRITIGTMEEMTGFMDALKKVLKESNND